jgi:phage FluMu protein Com
VSHFDYLRTGLLRNEVDVFVEMWNSKPKEINQFISQFNELTQTQQRKGKRFNNLDIISVDF